MEKPTVRGVDDSDITDHFDWTGGPSGWTGIANRDTVAYTGSALTVFNPGDTIRFGPSGEEREARQRGKVYAALSDQKVVRAGVFRSWRALDAPEMEKIAAIAVAALWEAP